MENDLPLSGDAASVATNEEVTQEVVTEENKSPEIQEGETEETTDDNVEGEKPKKSPEQLEINRLRKSTARLTRQREEARAELSYLKSQQQNSLQTSDDNQTLSLTRDQLEEFVNLRAKELAPIIQKQQSQVEQREAVIHGLEKSLGKDGFTELADNLADAFNGLDDGNGRIKPALDAVFYSDSPQDVLKYLADPDNLEEAESIASMNHAQAGRAIAKIEQKLEQAKQNAKPKPSSASKPLEALKGNGTAKGMPDPADTKAYIAWANQQDRR